MMWNSFAFPSSPEKYEPEFGLTKRELIAAMAMQGLLTCFADNHKVAEMAVKQADALIARLNADPVAEGANDGE